MKYTPYMDSYWIKPNGEEVGVPLEAPYFNHSETARLILAERGVDKSPIEAKDELIRRGWVRVAEMRDFEFRGLDRCQAAIRGFIANHAGQLADLVEFEDHESGQTRLLDPASCS